MWLSLYQQIVLTSVKILLHIVLFLTGFSSVYAQVTREDNLTDFDDGVKVVEKVYSGFGLKVTEETRPSYQHAKDSLRAAISNGSSTFEDAFGCYLAWFRDFHLHDVCGAQDRYMNGPIDYSSFMEYSPRDTYCKVDEKTFLIRYTSCVWSRKRKRWTKKAIRSFRRSHCENLILDIRGNKGGAAGTSDAFIDLLYDHDGYYNGVVIRNTPANIGYLRDAMRGDNYWQKHLDRCEQSEEEYPTLFEPHLVHYDKVSALPRKVAVIIDNQTASAAEEFLIILQRVSDRVSIFGRDHSLGCLDFANKRMVSLSKTGYRFSLPLTCSLGLPQTGIDATGIVPDVTIGLDYPTSLTDNVDEWVYWVAERLSEN